ncbi:histidine kinase [Cellulomonas fimi]|uniref:histidine kinase n=1 Tax=Cellulomonas fimi TaxID=1708 RepID=A0A7Y0LWR0_CELFI|nr:histidine kinase [Cellulomonas fimi]NMR19234.1 sensor histidine kinase [Cellulomonas fimi]
MSSAALEAMAALFYDAGLYPYPNAVSLYLVGAHAATRVRAVIGLVVGLTGIVVYWTLVPSSGVPWLPGFLVAVWALAWVAGQAERQRRRSAEDLLRRAQEAEQRRESERAAAVAAERARIAHEVHDVVGHALNVMVLQAGAARRMLGRDSEASAAALATVEGVGRDALADLDQALAVLDAPPDRRPARGLAAVDDLAAQLTAAGVPVHVRVVGTPRALTRPVDLAAFRVVQEALTNVAKHAAGSPAEVEIRYDDDALRLRVSDRAPGRAATASPSGRGLVGIRARAEALGGTAEVGPDPRGGWSVRCTLPVRA